MVRMPWSLKALAKFKHAEAVPTPSAFSDCDRARISESSAAAEGTATAATAAATMAEEEAEEEEVVVVAGQAEVGSEKEERLDTLSLFTDMLVLNLGGLIEKLTCGGVDSVS
jgi:ABC-type metal ion transport system substrate-binding protein